MTTRATIVFGATGGIGSRLCQRLAARGQKLVLVARNSQKLDQLADEVQGTPIAVDARNWQQVEHAFNVVNQRGMRPVAVAHCVGSLILKPAHTTSETEWNETMATNLTSAFAVLRSAAKAMIASGEGGSIALVSSAAARVGLINHEAIAAAKAGIIGLTLSAAASYAPRNIRVNCVAPGLTRTPMTERITQNDVSMKASIAMHPLGRLGEPDNVASALDWLLHPDQEWVTGQVLGVDGGLAQVRSR